MVRADELDREVNRLYWQTTEPVTRLAAQLDVSRGTFYNHLQPLPAGAKCSTCGGRLLFRTRSNRDAGNAHCGECEGEERLSATPVGKAAAASRKPRQSPPIGKEQAARAAAAEPRLRGRASPVPPPGRSADDEQRTQLLIIAVGAAVLGLGILYYARHRS